MITAQAGAGLLMLDQLKSRGVSVPPLRQATEARVAERLPGFTYTKNPVDTGRPAASFGEVVMALAEDPEIDAVIAYALHEPAAMNPVEVLPAAAAHSKKPLIFGTMGPREEVAPLSEALRSRRMFVAESPEQLAHVAAVLVEDARLQARLASKQISEPRVVEIEVPSRCDEHAAKQLLGAIGISTPTGIACASHEQVLAAFRRLEKPVAVKILAAEVLHKSDVGGVQLGVSDEPALREALERLDAVPLRSERRYLIEEMAPPGFEVIVGALRDASFGPTVMVGLGGVLAEALEDTVIRLAPLTLDEAQQMLAELRCSALLDGFRGSPPLDRVALARSIVRLGDLLCAHSGIKEIEVNPLRVYPQGVVALDGLLTVERLERDPKD